MTADLPTRDEKHLITRPMGDVPEGREFPPAPLPRGMRRMALRQCYSNAQRTALGTTAAPALDYAEGWALSDNLDMWVRHGWNVDEAGHAIDRTWPVPGRRYIGQVFPSETLAMAVIRRGYWAPLYEEDETS